MIDLVKLSKQCLSNFEFQGLKRNVKLIKQIQSLSIRSQFEESNYKRIKEDVIKHTHQFDKIIPQIFAHDERIMKMLEAERVVIEKRHKIARKALEPVLSIQKNINNFVRPIIEQQEKINNYVLPVIEQQEKINDFVRPIIEQQEKINNYLMPVIEQQEKINKLIEQFCESEKIALSFVNQINIPLINDIVEPLKKCFVTMPRSWVRIELMSQYWVIEDEKIIDKLALKFYSGKNLECYICKFYSDNNWHKLAIIIDQWAACSQIQHRFPILKACFETLKLDKDKNIVTACVIIPALIAQLDGIINEIIKIPSKKFMTKIHSNLGVKLDQENKKNSQKVNNKILQKIISVYFSNRYALIFYKVICEIFKNSYIFSEEMKTGVNVTNLNRHGILHGNKDSLGYGTEANLVRLFLYLDFMIKIIVGINNKDDNY